MKDFEQERREILRQKADVVLRQAACAIAEENLNEYKEAAAEAETMGAQAELPPELRRALDAAVCEAEKREAKKVRQGRRKLRTRSLTRVAVILLACVLIGGFVLTVTVDAFRIKLMDILLQDHGEYVDVNIVESGSLPPEALELIPEDWDELYYPGWLPEGYELVEADGRKETGKGFEFHSSGKGVLLFDYVKEDTPMMVDSEDSEIIHTTVKRYDAVCLKKEERLILIWAQDSYTFSIVCMEKEDLDQLVKVAENIMFISLK